MVGGFVQEAGVDWRVDVWGKSIIIVNACIPVYGNDQAWNP